MKMKRKVTYTSTLPEDILESVNEYAEKYNISKNKVMEEALRQFFFSEKKSIFRDGFKAADINPEMIPMAEAGMDEFLDIIQKYEGKGT
jgi:hypothetical protein